MDKSKKDAIVSVVVSVLLALLVAAAIIAVKIKYEMPVLLVD